MTDKEFESWLDEEIKKWAQLPSIARTKEYVIEQGARAAWAKAQEDINQLDKMYVALLKAQVTLKQKTDKLAKALDAIIEEENDKTFLKSSKARSIRGWRRQKNFAFAEQSLKEYRGVE